MNAPSGYVDLQVNGYADVDFNADELSAERVAAVCQRLRDEGVAGILATVITADLDAMCRRLANICRVRDADPAIADDDLGHPYRGPVPQRAARLHWRPSGGIRQAGRCRFDEAAARRRGRTYEDCHARARTRRKRTASRNFWQGRAFAFRPGIAIRRSTNCERRSTPACRYSLTWATVARARCRDTTTSFSGR